MPTNAPVLPAIPTSRDVAMKAHTSAPLNPVEAFIAKYEPNTVDGWAGFAQSFSTALRHYALESHKCTQAQETREKIADEHATGLDA